MPDVLVVDDDAGCVETLGLMLKQDGLNVCTAASAEVALKQIEKQAFDLILTDVRMPGMNGLELLKRLKAELPEVPVLLMTAHEDTRTAVEAMRAGASDFMMKPLHRTEVLHVVHKALGTSQPERDLPPPAPPAKDGLLGESPALRALREELGRAARSTLHVLLLGEPGTGKELAAREFHQASGRAKKPFIRVNCAALPETLFEAEMFGSMKGAHSTAFCDKPGHVELADGGTLFLDEIGELPVTAQAKLLRLLQEHEYQRVGEGRTRKADVRFISATNRPVKDVFRADFLERINGVTLRLPPLRDHAEDIPLLVRRFLPGKFSDAALALLTGHDWPGNVRELKNCLERLTVFSTDGQNIGEGDVRRELDRHTYQAASPVPAQRRTLDCSTLKEALQRAGNNRSQAARLLGVSRRTLYYKMDACGLSGEPGS